MSTTIEWTDETWNPTVGCSKTSPGCDNCYAINVAHRAMQPAHEGLTIVQHGQRPDWTGEVRLLPDRLDTPLRWRKPRRVFVDSMSDLFHPDVPESFIRDVFDTMRRCPQHTFQVLTKRPQRMAQLVPTVAGGDGVPGNVWLGTSIESDRYTFRADYLRRSPAAIQFLSLEPLLGPLPSLDLGGIEWVIVGGESGPGARPMHPDWARDIRDRCLAAGVPFFFKQWGSWGPAYGHLDHGEPRLSVLTDTGELERWSPNRHGSITSATEPAVTGHGQPILLRGDKNRRHLDGRTWDQCPKAVAS